MFKRYENYNFPSAQQAYIDNQIVVTRIAISALKRDYTAELKRLGDKLQELEESR